MLGGGVCCGSPGSSDFTFVSFRSGAEPFKVLVGLAVVDIALARVAPFGEDVFGGVVVKVVPCLRDGVETGDDVCERGRP